MLLLPPLFDEELCDPRVRGAIKVQEGLGAA